MKNYDIVILGGGPGGYVAAIKAAQLKQKVALIEKGTVGGVCLNWGCIPTKAMLKTAKVYSQFMHASDYGLEITDKSVIKVDLKLIKKRKDKIVKRLTDGVKMLLKKNGVDLYNGFGTVNDPHSISVNEETLKTKKLILATGAHPFIPPIEGLQDAIDNSRAVTAKGILELEKLPKTLTVIGGGVIGVEFATLYSNLGTKVTVIEMEDRILTPIDDEVRDKYMSLFLNDNIELHLNSKVTQVTDTEVVYEKDGETHSVEAEKILVSIGTRPNMKGLEALDLEMTHNGVKTNHKLETNIQDVYAIGDMNGIAMLAHVASKEGIVAVENIIGETTHIDYLKVPSGIYGFPEIAYVGMTEQQAKEKNIDYMTSVFPLSANGKALAEGESGGLIKLIADKKYNELIGMHILSPNATDMISEGVIALELESTADEIAASIHPHPTLSESIMEAAHGVVDKPIHI
ncbi:MAG: dihydrolipoyl dehydrogenase [Candidatus Izimaplasma sp.]|nr:dihydrolipoyl dehydrogenase [Candidatus Izimaplasma bacterium]